MGQTTGYDGVLRNCTLPCGNYDSEKKKPGVSVLPWCVWFPNHEIKNTTGTKVAMSLLTPTNGTCNAQSLVGKNV